MCARLTTTNYYYCYYYYYYYYHYRYFYLRNPPPPPSFLCFFFRALLNRFLSKIYSTYMCILNLFPRDVDHPLDARVKHTDIRIIKQLLNIRI